MTLVVACVKTEDQKVSQWLDPQRLKYWVPFAFYPSDHGRPPKDCKQLKWKQMLIPNIIWLHREERAGKEAKS